MTVEQGNGGNQDQFPIGMRVLAVDDDLTCLMVLENLLRKCQYHVTTTNQARMALKILRERRSDFDLVISDVHMPDMDGFHLLEKVGLEMDLPVIMLSANSDPKVVMKGITHGACDYLLKPIRIEELKNIWQHVVRRKKSDNRNNNGDSPDKPQSQSGETTFDHKLNKKRKDQNDEDDDGDENGNDNDDPTSQKKPRVVWSVELHRKFVSAVNQLGIDKAVPKKILELMNVEKLSRENVASHLQKYRLYLRRISTVANQHANMAAALGSTDASYLQMGGSLTGIGLHNVAGNGQFQNGAAGYRAVTPNVMLGRLNSPAGMNIHGLPSSGMVQAGAHVQGGHLTAHQRQFHSSVISNASILQGMPVSLELDQIQPNNKGLGYTRQQQQQLPPAIDATQAAFPPDPSMIVGGGGGTNGSFIAGPASERPLFLDQGRCNENWSNAAAHSTGSTNLFLDPCDVPSHSTLPVHLQGTKADLACRVVSASSNAPQQQGWDRLAAPSYDHFNNVGSSSLIPDNGGADMISQRWDANNGILLRTPSFSSTGQQPNFADTSLVKHTGLGVPVGIHSVSSIGRPSNQHQNLQVDHSNFSSLEDLSAFMGTREWTR